jgi:hypothetical protein
MVMASPAVTAALGAVSLSVFNVFIGTQPLIGILFGLLEAIPNPFKHYVFYLFQDRLSTTIQNCSF